MRKLLVVAIVLLVVACLGVLAYRMVWLPRQSAAGGQTAAPGTPGFDPENFGNR